MHLYIIIMGKYRLIFVLWLFVFLTGCVKEELSKLAKEPAVLKELRLDYKNIVLEVGETYQFKPTTVPFDFEIDKYKWSVYREDGDGYIDNDGLFTATKSGWVKIEVTTPNIKDLGNMPFFANIKVKIKDKEDDEDDPSENKPEISDIIFDKSAVTLKKGETTTISYSVLPENADVSGIKWNVSDNSVVSITSISSGQIEINALKTGEAEVYTTVDGKRYACHVTVEAIAVESIILNPSYITIKQGESFTLDVSVYPYNADNSELKFEFSDNSIAYFTNEEQRIINTSNPGECTVTVSTKDGTVKAECIITVLEIPLEEKITASTRLNGLNNNGFITGTVYIEFYNGSDKDVTITRFYVYDSFSNQTVYEEKDCGTLMGGHDWSTALIFKMVYKPLYIWEYECDGKSYTLTKAE